MDSRFVGITEPAEALSVAVVVDVMRAFIVAAREDSLMVPCTVPSPPHEA
ncbi:hypothetical protein [[Kitasatospora] papulosa]